MAEPIFAGSWERCRYPTSRAHATVVPCAMIHVTAGTCRACSEKHALALSNPFIVVTSHSKPQFYQLPHCASVLPSGNISVL